MNSLKIRIRYTSLVVLTLTVLTCEGVRLQAAEAPQWVSGQILVQHRAGLPPSEFDRILRPYQGRSIRFLPQLNLHVIELPPEANEAVVARALSRNPHIEFSEPDVLIPPEDILANDLYFDAAWHLPMIGALRAWDFSQGTGIVAAILDTGVDPSHPDLSGQLVPGWNMYDDNSDTADVYGHGTMVAGVVAALSNNEIGVTSIAWNAQIMPVRISRPDGWATTSTIAAGLVWAADNGADVANISYGVSGSSAVKSAAEYMRSLNGVVVVSAGNGGAYQATLPSSAMISVSATGSTDTITSWSTYGEFVDVSAPGVGIWTTSNGGGYSAPSGTSFSSPITAAVVALMMAANPSLSSSQLEDLLVQTADDLGTEGFDIFYGYGRVNAAAAVELAAGGPVVDSEAPSVLIMSPTGGEISGIVSVTVSASDNVEVVRVDLYADGQFVASDNGQPYEFSWDSTQYSDGMLTLEAMAYDGAANEGISSPVEVAILNGGEVPNPDTTPPMITISEPEDGATVSGKVQIRVSAQDDQQVASLNLYVDGVWKAGGTSGLLSYRWNTRGLAKGWHTITAVAEDQAMNSSSASIVVNLGGGGGRKGGGKGKKVD
ncbi:MAG: S8 family serine peptidase [Acidobacteriota bacterium]